MGISYDHVESFSFFSFVACSRVALVWKVFLPPNFPVPFPFTLLAAAGWWAALRRLQEVVGRPARDHGFAGSRARIELQAEMNVSDNRISMDGGWQ